MKPIEEILSDKRHIYSDNVEISDDGFRGYMNVDRTDMTFVASWGGGWEHVSVAPVKRNKIPTWEQMCAVKDVFFKDDEAVIQIHPPKAEYVNMMTNCLHLWRPISKQLVLPRSYGGTVMEKETEIIAENIKRFIYASTLNLSKAETVDLLADLASWNVDFMLMETKGYLDLATGEDKK